MIYFVPEAAEEYGRLGIHGRHGYFASRSAPMGAVSAAVVVATFFNFNPAIVHAAIPAAWDAAEPAAILSARLQAADRALRRVLGDAVESDDLAEAAALVREAASAASCGGRPLAAAHAALPWPDEPHLALWHGVTVLREHRGDGHIAALTLAGVSGIEALVMHAASGEVPSTILQSTRGVAGRRLGGGAPRPRRTRLDEAGRQLHRRGQRGARGHRSHDRPCCCTSLGCDRRSRMRSGARARAAVVEGVGTDAVSNAGTGYLVAPTSGRGPGVLVLHSWWGLTPFFRDTCDRLADEGFVALAPDLHGGRIADRPDEAERLLAEIDPNPTAALVLSSAATLRGLAITPDAPIGAIGFSMGASWALWLSARAVDDVGAVVAFYGAQDVDFKDAQAAYLAHWAEHDEFVDDDEIAFLEASLHLEGHPVEFHRYPGTGHWFFESDRPPAFDAAAADLAWQRTIDFLRRHLSV